jgi:hypothetical protein
MTLIEQALQVAQEYDLAIFPCGSNKRPLIKGWRTRATRNPDDIRTLFGMSGAAGIAVPCGPDNDILCFDLDFGHDPTPEARDKMTSWLREHQVWELADEDKLMVRETQSGGLHVLTSWPFDADKVPRRIMPKLDVICDGFYFVWATESGGYKQLGGELSGFTPSYTMMEVVEKGQGSDGSALMSQDEAHGVMMTNGDAGMRHDAILKMTQDWAQDHPADDIGTWCQQFENWFTDMYADKIQQDRLDQLLEWNVEDERGELFRAFNGVAQTPEMAGALMAKAGDKLRAAGKLKTPTPAQDIQREVRKEAAVQSVGEFTEIDLDELKTRDLPDVDWIIEDVIPAGNLIGMAGPSGAGKTRILSALIAALCSGNTDIIGLPRANRPIRTLYVANEERTSDIERRVKAAAVANGMSGSLPITVRGKEHGQMRLANDEGPIVAVVDELASRIKAAGIELVIFDPFNTLGSGDENSAQGVDGVISAMQMLMASTGCAVMFIHHTPKGERGAAVDEVRGDGTAFRGSGAIFSPLDIAMTLSPYLPPSCHDAKSGKANRRSLLQAQRDRRVPKFICLDSAKERESEGFPSVYYRLDGVEVREGGKKIGAVVQVSENEADQTCNAVLQAMPDAAVDRVIQQEWARVILAEYPDQGTQRVSLAKVVELLNYAEPSGWVVSTANRPSFSERAGKAVYEMLAQPVSISGVSVRLERRGQVLNWIVE